MGRGFFIDLIERTLRTFVQGFLSVVTLDAFSAGFDPRNRERVTVVSWAVRVGPLRPGVVTLSV